MTAGRRVTREEQRKSTRRRIIAAARASFNEHGNADVPMDQIARAANVGRATLYLHFANRESLLIELLAQNLAAVRQVFSGLCDVERLDVEAAKAWLLHYIDTLRSHRDAMQLVRISIAATREARLMIHEHHRKLAEMLTNRFVALRDGTVRDQVRLLLLIGRIDHFASAAAETPPHIDPETGLDLVSHEMTALLADGGRGAD